VLLLLLLLLPQLLLLLLLRPADMPANYQFDHFDLAIFG
jgi:hypothetical protein